jgi:hypothetical protein
MHADVVLHGLAKCSNESCVFCRGDEACEEAQLDPYIRHACQQLVKHVSSLVTQRVQLCVPLISGTTGSARRGMHRCFTKLLTCFTSC